MDDCGITLCDNDRAAGKAYCPDHLDPIPFVFCEWCGGRLADGDKVVESQFMGLPNGNYHPVCWNESA